MRIFISLSLLFFFASSFAQSKKEIIQIIRNENQHLKDTILDLNTENLQLKTEIVSLKATVDSFEKVISTIHIETPEEFAQTIFNLFRYRKLNDHPELQIQLSDTPYLAKNPFLCEFKELLESGVMMNTDRTYFEGINLGINWSKAVFKTSHFVIKQPNPAFNAFTLTGELFFTYKGKEFSLPLREGFTFTENNRWKGFYFDSIIDCATDEVIALEQKKSIENEREKAIQDYFKTPLVPSGLWMGDAVHFWSPKKTKYLTGLQLTVKNNTPYDYSKIAYHLEIVEDGNVIFSKNLELTKEIGSEEIITFVVDELNSRFDEVNDIFIKSGVPNAKWYSVVRVLDVYPKPPYTP
jgi:hypothetical protein